jgi:type IV pilus assembly protein PilN
MIKINLLGEKKDNTALYVLQGLGFGAAVVVAVLLCFVIHTTETSELEYLESQKAVLDVRLAKLRKKTKKVDELEKMRKLKTEKLTTIATLKSKKQGPVRVLADLTESVPERAWLRQVTQRGSSVEFTGIALDNQTVSRFMANLEKSEFFHSVDLLRSAQYIRDDVKLQQFSLSAKLVSLLDKKAADDAKKKAASETAATMEKSMEALKQAAKESEEEN